MDSLPQMGQEGGPGEAIKPFGTILTSAGGENVAQRRRVLKEAAPGATADTVGLPYPQHHKHTPAPRERAFT